MYLIESIINDEDVANLKTIYDALPVRYAHQDYNLFDVERRNVPRSLIIENTSLSKLKEYSKMNNKGFYFLKYEKDSFTRVHHDENSDLTIVTTIEQKDLVGGYPICYTTYKKSARPAYKYANRSKEEEEKKPIGKDIIPEIIEVKEGQSIVYGPKLKHGVSKVTSGHRIVLISWFNRR